MRHPWNRVVLGFFGLALLSFLLLSNFFDWDHFFATHEADFRSWILDGQPPLWSYQFCAGSSRVGDPQALGLSPLFMWVLLLGPIWGSKVLVFCCVLIGAYYTRKLLLLWVQTLRSEQSNSTVVWVDVVTVMFWGSNFFLWHLHVGHVTFALMGLGVGLVYYTWKAWLQSFSRWDWLWGTLLSATYYAGGFIQSTVYFLLPLFLAMALAWGGYTIRLLLKKQSVVPWLKRWAASVGFHLLGILLASYKLYAVMAYQRELPRTLSASTEYVSLKEIVLAHFVPTFNHSFVGLGKSLGTNKFGIWENSQFNVLVWLLLIYAGWWVWRKIKASSANDESEAATVDSDAHDADKGWLIWLFLACYGVIALAFSLGDTLSWGPHSWFNQTVFHGSIRVVQRYQVSLLLFVTLGATAVWARDEQFQTFFVRVLAIPLLALVGLNALSFTSSLSLGQLQFLLKKKGPRQTKMKWLVISPHRRGSLPQMHQIVKLNMGVINCYTPLRLDHRAFAREMPYTRKGVKFDGFTSVSEPRLRPFSLIDRKTTKASKACLRKSYYTQTHVVVAPECPRRVCLNIRQPNPYLSSNWTYDAKIGKYCRR